MDIFATTILSKVLCENVEVQITTTLTVTTDEIFEKVIEIIDYSVGRFIER